MLSEAQSEWIHLTQVKSSLVNSLVISIDLETSRSKNKVFNQSIVSDLEKCISRARRRSETRGPNPRPSFSRAHPTVRKSLPDESSFFRSAAGVRA
ncbi:hypothetical protein EVAR_39107_1 [Eumeta japonica]|uniref:Uncharacterized protein n=1 Tax=Eumeta variegata TaxID=151549 RepID=A0A4C1X3W2_EUMVA|nr:hypothetical protein EVAR_39107_1 [Eumeta japonica]